MRARGLSKPQQRSNDGIQRVSSLEMAPLRERRRKEGERKAKGRERNLLRREIEKNSETKLAKQWFTLGQRSK